MIFDLQRFDTTENTNSITIICGAPGELTHESGASSSANLTSVDIQIRKLARIKNDVVPGMIISFTADSDHITIHAGAKEGLPINLHVQVSDDSQVTVSKVNGPAWCLVLSGKWFDEQTATLINGDGLVAVQPPLEATPGDYELVIRAMTRVNGSIADRKELTITVTVLEPEE